MAYETRSIEIAVHTHGEVDAGSPAYAREKVAHVGKLAPGPVLFAKVDLVEHADPARAERALAKAELDVNGRVVRAHATSATMHEAIDRLEARLRAGLEHLPRRRRGAK
jgi:ribosome-associated translation inhibitor RaiA